MVGEGRRGGRGGRGRGGRGEGEQIPPPAPGQNVPYIGTLLTRNRTHASNRAYDNVSYFNFYELIYLFKLLIIIIKYGSLG
jgi:hypothetical protein